MSSLYTKEVRNYISTRPWPKDLIFEVVEKEDCLKLRMFRDNLNKLETADKIYLTGLINETLGKISRSGIPIFVWVAEGDGSYV